MKKCKVTMFEVINKEPRFYFITVFCNDIATDIWLNPVYKNIWDVEQIN